MKKQWEKANNVEQEQESRGRKKDSRIASPVPKPSEPSCILTNQPYKGTDFKLPTLAATLSTKKKYSHSQLIPIEFDFSMLLR